MSGAQTMATLRRYRWALALTAVVVLGYSFGKDMALRDNARDAGIVAGESA